MNADQILLHIARGECLTEAKPEDLPLWIDRFAELLGCDPRPASIAVAIEHLQNELERAMKFQRRLRDK